MKRRRFIAAVAATVATAALPLPTSSAVAAAEPYWKAERWNAMGDTLMVQAFPGNLREYTFTRFDGMVVRWSSIIAPADADAEWEFESRMWRYLTEPPGGWSMRIAAWGS